MARLSAAPMIVSAGLAVVLCTDVAARVAAHFQTPAVPLTDLLTRAAAYVADYKQTFTAIVSEELYTQQVQSRGTDSGRHRVTRGDMLLVNLGGNRWVGFRDVFEVDGSPVRDHDQRLEKLFSESPGALLARASQIAAESARFNIGTLRTINVPTIALDFLDQTNQARSTFRMLSDDRVNDAPAAVVQFTERMKPTIIRDASGGNQSANGQFWIDAASGRVLKSELRIDSGMTHVTVTVTYGFDSKVAMWVPIKMSERYESSVGEVVTAYAVYSNFRKYSVDIGTIK